MKIREIKKELKELVDGSINWNKVKIMLPHYIAKYAKEFGFLDETKYRNYCIKIEYKEMRSREIPSIECREYLAKKYGRSDEQIRTILFR